MIMQNLYYKKCQKNIIGSLKFIQLQKIFKNSDKETDKNNGFKSSPDEAES